MYTIPSREHKTNTEGLIKRQEMKNAAPVWQRYNIFGNQFQLLNICLFCLSLNIDSTSLSVTGFQTHHIQCRDCSWFVYTDEA